MSLFQQDLPPIEESPDQTQSAATPSVAFGHMQMAELKQPIVAGTTAYLMWAIVSETTQSGKFLNQGLVAHARSPATAEWDPSPQSSGCGHSAHTTPVTARPCIITMPAIAGSTSVIDTSQLSSQITLSLPMITLSAQPKVKPVRTCRRCGTAGNMNNGKLVEKWRPGPEGPGTLCDKQVSDFFSQRVRLKWPPYRCGARWKRENAKLANMSRLRPERSIPSAHSQRRDGGYGGSSRVITRTLVNRRQEFCWLTPALTAGNGYHSATRTDVMDYHQGV